MIVKVLPFAFLMVTVLLAFAALYYWVRNRLMLQRMLQRKKKVAQALELETANNTVSANVSALDKLRAILDGSLRDKRVKTQGTSKSVSAVALSGSLSKILDRTENLTENLAETPKGRNTALPPPPTSSKRIQASLEKAAARNEAPEKTGTLETLIVKMYDDYLSEIAQFQQSVSSASSVGEILNKACRALSALASRTRVAFLEYQAPQRALMVSSRSAPTVFAGTQPRMFLPQSKRIDQNAKNLSPEDLRTLFARLPQDAELQRLLSDSTRLEARSADQEILQEQIWEAQKKWRVYPLYVRGLPQGVFVIQENSTCQRREFDRIVSIFLSVTSLAVENLRLHSKMVEVAARDTATGLQTRKAFQDRLYQSFLIARRLQHPLTVLRLDVDHMAAYTKQYGSSVTESILRHVTRHLEKCFRKSDVMARYSAEGFAVILPHTAFVDAMKKVESLLQAIGESKLKLGRGEQEISIRVSVSGGVAEFPSHADNPADLIRFASEALYRGQGYGRGVCTIAKVPTGYVPPFNSRFIRSSPKALQENVVSPILDA
jgi:diguanylate cyclase (GGDEF)-like protein